MSGGVIVQVSFNGANDFLTGSSIKVGCCQCCQISLEKYATCSEKISQKIIDLPDRKKST